jgi:MFS family permease
MGLADSLLLFYIFGAAAGLLGSIAGPARGSMVADLLPPEKRADGFGLMRVAANLTFAIGPGIGGLIASRSYMLLFIIDAVVSVITAVIFFLTIPETKPEASPEQEKESFIETLKGYRIVAKDTMYIAFLAFSMLLLLVYMQMNTTLPYFMNRVRGIPPEGYGYILSMNATLVVLLQFWVTRKVSKRPPMLVMATGSILCAIGFAMFGIFSLYIFFIIGMLIITAGELIIMPVSQAVAANFAPENMRGRYMAFYGYSWTIPSALAPYLAGLLMDRINPNNVWLIAGIVAVVATGGFVLLHQRIGTSFASRQARPPEAATPKTTESPAPETLPASSN